MLVTTRPNVSTVAAAWLVAATAHTLARRAETPPTSPKARCNGEAQCQPETTALMGNT